MADEITPPEGAPEANNENPLHQDFINSAPEDLRPYAEQLVPVWDKYVQDQFQTHARYKPLQDVSDDEINDFLQYRERITSGTTPAEQAAAAKAWHDEYGAALRENYPDLFEEEAPAGNGEYFSDEDNPVIKQLQAQVTELMQDREQTRTQQRQMEAADFVQTELDKVKPEFGELSAEDWEHVKDDICALASRYDPRDPEVIQKGFTDYQRIVNKTEGALFEKKLTHPKPAERGGTTEAHTGPPLNYDDAGDAARMRIREAMKHGG